MAKYLAKLCATLCHYEKVHIDNIAVTLAGAVLVALLVAAAADIDHDIRNQILALRVGTAPGVVNSHLDNGLQLGTALEQGAYKKLVYVYAWMHK